MSEPRYVLVAMTEARAHLSGYSQKWFDERARTRKELEAIVGAREGTPARFLAELAFWPTQDGS